MAEAASQTLRFHRSLYLPEAIDEAVRAFADLAAIRAVHNPQDTLVTIERPQPEVAEVIADELANYALAETIVRSKGAAA